jgi:hypothetical protein
MRYVAKGERSMKDADDDIQEYVKPWVGLTDEEIWQWFRDNTALTSESGKRIYDAIEAKLKEKNT